jgi:hypothetical protein
MLCPVDLAACDHHDCRSGVCERTDAACVTVCWACGAVDEHVVDGFCVTCLSVFAAPRAAEKA